MVTLFQEFKLVYPDGELFFDRSGALTRRLRSLFPEMDSEEADFDRREFNVASESLELLVGIAISRIKSLAVGDDEFAERAQQFVACITETLEIETLGRFSYGHVLGRVCSTNAEAQELMWPIVGNGQTVRMQSVSPQPIWTALQTEFTEGPLSYESRIAIVDAVPSPDLNIGGHLLEKMRAIVFPAVEMAAATLAEAVEYLTVKSRDLDTSGDSKGVPLEIDSAVASNPVALSLSFREIPMLELLRAVLGLAGLKFKFAPDRVLIVDRSDAGTLPHLTVRLTATGQEPISVADFDVAAFIKNVRQTHTGTILSKLAPHLQPL